MEALDLNGTRGVRWMRKKDEGARQDARLIVARMKKDEEEREEGCAQGGAEEARGRKRRG